MNFGSVSHPNSKDCMVQNKVNSSAKKLFSYTYEDRIIVSLELDLVIEMNKVST